MTGLRSNAALIGRRSSDLHSGSLHRSKRQLLPERLPDTQHPHANASGSDAHLAGNLFRRVSFEAPLQQLAIALGAAFEQTVHLNLLDVHEVGRIDAIHRHGRFRAELGAEQIPGNRIHPETDQAGIAQLVAMFPSASPGCLGNLLRFAEMPRRGIVKIDAWPGKPASNASAYSFFRITFAAHATAGPD